MDIIEALNALDGFFDCLCESGCLSEEEGELMNECEDVICNFVHSVLKERESSFTGC